MSTGVPTASGAGVGDVGATYAEIAAAQRFDNAAPWASASPAHANSLIGVFVRWSRGGTGLQSFGCQRPWTTSRAHFSASASLTITPARFR